MAHSQRGRVLGDGAELDHLVSHIDHGFAPARIGDSENFSGGGVVEEGGLLIWVGGCHNLADGPAKGSELVDDGLGVLLQGRRAVAQDKAPVSGCCHLDGLQVGKGNITDVHGTHVLGADRLHLTIHQGCKPLN